MAGMGIRQLLSRSVCYVVSQRLSSTFCNIICTCWV